MANKSKITGAVYGRGLRGLDFGSNSRRQARGLGSGPLQLHYLMDSYDEQDDRREARQHAASHGNDRTTGEE